MEKERIVIYPEDPESEDPNDYQIPRSKPREVPEEGEEMVENV